MKAVVGPAGEPAAQHVGDLLGQLLALRTHVRRGIVKVGMQNGHLGRPVEGRRAGETLVRDARQRVQIGATVLHASLDLLGRGVLDTADEAARAREPGSFSVLRDAEVGEVHMVTRLDEDVGGLHVAMDKTAACAASSAAAICETIFTVTASGSGPSDTSARRSVPSTRRMTM